MNNNLLLKKDLYKKKCMDKEFIKRFRLVDKTV